MAPLPSEPQGKPKNTGVGSLSLLQWIFLTSNQTGVSCIVVRFFTNWAIREALMTGSRYINSPISPPLGWGNSEATVFTVYRVPQKEKAPSWKWLIQFSSVAQLCPILCNPMDCSMPGLGRLIIHHQLSRFTQTHVHWVSDAIQPSHPLSSPSPSIFNLSQHQVFSNETVLCIRWPKNWSFSFSISPSNEYSGLISFRMDCWISLLSKGLSRLVSNTTVQKHQFFNTQLSLQSSSYIYTWLLEKI